MVKHYYSDGSVSRDRDYKRTLHRLRGPAIIREEGFKSCYEWYQNGLRHRKNGPAVISSNVFYFTGNYKQALCGTYEGWFQNGKEHRVGAPAIVFGDGSQEWYQNGKLHRVDGPAVISKKGYKDYCEWHIDGRRFRYINGKEFTKEEFEKHILTMQLSGLLDE